MGVNFPDAATLHSVLDLATRAPSVNDAQPWRWHVGHGALDLFADPSRYQTRDDDDHDRDRGRRAELLSCGAALHHCVVALAALGWHATVARLPRGCDSDHLARVEVTREAIAALGPGAELLPGMPAEVLIVRTERTMLDYLIEPLRDAFRRSFREV